MFYVVNNRESVVNVRVISSYKGLESANGFKCELNGGNYYFGYIAVISETWIGLILQTTLLGLVPFYYSQCCLGSRDRFLT